MWDPYGQFLVFVGFVYGKIWKKNPEKQPKQPFFRADMARLGKYCTGVYNRIGVYRVKSPPAAVTLYRKSYI